METERERGRDRKKDRVSPDSLTGLMQPSLMLTKYPDSVGIAPLLALLRGHKGRHPNEDLIAVGSSGSTNQNLDERTAIVANVNPGLNLGGLLQLHCSYIIHVCNVDEMKSLPVQFGCYQHGYEYEISLRLISIAI